MKSILRLGATAATLCLFVARSVAADPVTITSGSLLVTHWGLSGPAVIRLSAWAAQHLHGVNYDFSILVSWIGSMMGGVTPGTSRRATLICCAAARSVSRSSPTTLMAISA